MQRITRDEEDPAMTLSKKVISERFLIFSHFFASSKDKVNHLKDFRHLFANKCADIPSEREDDNNEVVHGSADGKCLCMVVQTVASRKINHIHLDPKIYYTCHFFHTLLVILCMTGTSVCAKRPVLP